MSLTYSVVLLKEKKGEYSVIVPALEGCATYGETLPDALHNAEEAILAHIDGLNALGKPVPSDLERVTIDMGEATEAAVYKVAVRREAAE